MLTLPNEPDQELQDPQSSIVDKDTNKGDITNIEQKEVAIYQSNWKLKSTKLNWKLNSLSQSPMTS